MINTFRLQWACINQFMSMTSDYCAKAMRLQDRYATDKESQLQYLEYNYSSLQIE